VNQCGDVAIQGIDGKINVLNLSGNISLQVNKLSEKSENVVKAVDGSISVNLNPEISARVRLQGPNANEIVVIAENFRVAKASAFLHGIEGSFEGQLRDKNLHGRSALISGKIDLISAEKYSLHSQRFTTNGDEHLSECDGSKISNSSQSPLLSVVAALGIRIETLSWMQAIRRKHGFAD
jgi:hypothetical protein